MTLGLEVGKDRLVDMIEKFGFTKKLGIDFPGEAAGQLPEKWNGVTIDQVPMGQGIAVSPLQLAAAYAAIANDGVLVQPHLVRDAAATLEPAGGQPDRRRSTAGDAARSPWKRAPARRPRLEGYEVAGKTGTAQKLNEKSAGYSERGHRLVRRAWCRPMHPAW